MCELLIRLTSKVNADPIVDRRGTWKAGMVITAQADGWRWSETEKMWPYKVVPLPAIPVTDVTKWLEPDYETIISEEPEVDDIEIPYRRRRLIVDIEQLTLSMCQSLENTLTKPAERLAVLDTITADTAIEELH